MLRIHKINTKDNILREDLTGIESDYLKIKTHQQEMMRLCNEHQGAGLASSQVGLRENFFFLAASAKIPSKRGKPVAHMCINPTWMAHASSSKSMGQEGCLSLPGRHFWVEREDVIAAEWTNAVGHRQHIKLKGWPARVFQHEYDHLKGITLIQSGKEVTDA